MKIKLLLISSLFVAPFAQAMDPATEGHSRLKYEETEATAVAVPDSEPTLAKLSATLQIALSNQKRLSDNQGVLGAGIDRIEAKITAVLEAEQQRLRFAQEQHETMKLRSHPCYSISVMVATNLVVTGLMFTGKYLVENYS